MLKIFLFLALLLFPQQVFGGISSVKATEDNTVIVTLISGKILNVPATQGNRHYRQVLTWVSSGGVITPEDAWADTVAQARTKRKEELKAEGRVLFRGVALDLEYSSAQVNAFKDCLRAGFSAAKNSINALVDIEVLKAFNITWCNP